MFCSNCGSENTSDAQFCKKCGKPLSTSGSNLNEKQTSKPENNNKNSEVVKPTEPKAKVDINQLKNMLTVLPRKIWIGAGLLILAVIINISIGWNPSVTIDLNKYITIELEGFDGYGEADAVIDWDSIEDEYGEKLSFKSQAEKEYGNLVDFLTPVEVLDEYIFIDFVDSRYLNNGDVIEYSWYIDEELADVLNCKVKYKDDTFTVSGLEEVQSVDSFADLEVTYSGVAPDGQVEIVYEGRGLERSDFVCDKVSGLSNGDVVTITIKDENLEDYAEFYGKVPEVLEKKYKVHGLYSYLSARAEVDSETFEWMQSLASDIYRAKVAKNWGEGESLENFAYIGDYLLTKKNLDFYNGVENIFYLVFKAQVRNKYTNDEETYNQVNDIYWYIAFEDLLLDSDGALFQEITDYSQPNSKFTIDSGVNSGWWNTKSWYYSGYESLDALYKDIVTSQIDAYNHEDNVDELLTPESTELSDTKQMRFVFSNSDTALIESADVEVLSVEECIIARNEIYARHGRKFDDQSIQDYFDSCDWYEGIIEAGEFDESELSDIELNNVNLIAEYEEKKKTNE